MSIEDIRDNDVDYSKVRPFFDFYGTTFVYCVVDVRSFTVLSPDNAQFIFFTRAAFLTFLK